MSYIKHLSKIVYVLVTILFLNSIESKAQYWVQEQKVADIVRQYLDNFGGAVAVSGNYAIVGASQEDHDAQGKDSLRDAGAVYVYQKTNNKWTLIKR